MTDQPNDEGRTTSARGEAAWKETRERLSARNLQARKEGRARREVFERERDGLLRAAKGRRHQYAGGRRTP